MLQFAEGRALSDPERRIALADGSPGLALAMDLDVYDERRKAMLRLLQVSAGRAAFAEWLKHAEALAVRKQEKLEHLLKILYVLLEDVLLLTEGGQEIRNADIRKELDALAAHVSFDWIRAAVRRADEISEFIRRNIQKNIALDALVIELQRLAA
jgi:DNA polymerase-3 subunit delta'